MTPLIPHSARTLSERIVRIYRNWTLPLAILCGTLVFAVTRYTPCLAPYRPALLGLTESSMPLLIGVMLFLTFCRVSPADLRPKRWQWWLFAVQAVACLVVVCVSKALALSGHTLALAQGILACFIAPTATAAAVITAKLTTPAEAGTVTIHALLQGIVVSFLISLFFPLMTAHPTLDFAALALRLVSQSARLLLLPLLLAWGLRYLLPRLQAALAERAGWAFYLWGIALAMVTAQTLRVMTHSHSVFVLMLHVVAALLVCACNFALGRAIGQRYGHAIAAGQALGQKNTIFALWMAYSFLQPAAALAPGAYVIWQNSFNAWQLWRTRKHTERGS